ncbi:hypothetical protein ACFOOP_04050 [Marinicaulis aureus]|uniref:Sel1 repeat family protein n=1 Tax=Hyphococcus aureus TaxID=2666033 RepID=A0ABW1KXC7_9PROT
MKLKFEIFSVVLMAALMAACALPRRVGPNGGPNDGLGGGPRGEVAAGPSAGAGRPSALLAAAREQQAKEGCAKAAPAYRIVASYGEGYEIAQYELGACLMQMTGAGDPETMLFRQEGVFWLSRAAWAGDARAQGRLAEALSGAQGYAASHLGPDPEAALMWSLVYTANGSRDVYGLRPLPSLVTEHIASVLSADAEERARQKAVQFTRVTMEAFVAPAMPQTARGGRDSGSGRPPGGGGDRPPRRQLETAS